MVCLVYSTLVSCFGHWYCNFPTLFIDESTRIITKFVSGVCEWLLNHLKKQQYNNNNNNVERTGVEIHLRRQRRRVEVFKRPKYIDRGREIERGRRREMIRSWVTVIRGPTIWRTKDSIIETTSMAIKRRKRNRERFRPNHVAFEIVWIKKCD